MTPLNNYAQVQAALDAFVQAAGVTPALAPHGVFWHSLTYQQFITQNVPGVTSGNYKILEVGNAAASNIMIVLTGMPANAPVLEDVGMMPQPNPPYNPEQATIVAQLTDWINRNCPN
jgi:hypothetical protein